MTTWNDSLLNINQHGDELNALYDGDYYWYLRSPQFAEAFLKRIAGIVRDIAGPEGSCLDVGCGEGQLGEFVSGYYVGIDGSSSAVERGTKAGRKNLHVRRFENPEPWPVSFADVVVFGGIMEVLVKPEGRAPLLNFYAEKLCPKAFVVYDLERLDTSAIIREFELIQTVHSEAVGIDLEPVKCRRKILVFQCRR